METSGFGVGPGAAGRVEGAEVGPLDDGLPTADPGVAAGGAAGPPDDGPLAADGGVTVLII